MAFDFDADFKPAAPFTGLDDPATADSLSFNGGIAQNKTDLLAGLNEPQKKAVLHKDGPLLILAGAGSGKTKVITHRIAYLVEHENVPASSILAITFTNKAAQEMRQRIIKLIGNRVQGMWVGTFHAMFLRILRNHAELLGFTKRFTVADTDDQLKMIKACLDELEFNDKSFPPRQVLSMISKAKNLLQNPDDYRLSGKGNYFINRVADVYRLYAAKLQSADAMDFDDILYYAVRLFTEHKDVRYHYCQLFNYILVDEYQDTNGAQYRLIKLLTSGKNNLCVVGDDDQSIYSFRGADITNILNFEKDFPACEVIKLEQNYRSTESILGAANAIIAHNTERKDKTLWTAKAGGNKIKLLNLANQDAEAKYVAAQIIDMRRADPTLNYSDFAILYRLNALSRSLEFALRDQGIEYRIYGSVRFFDRKEIKDVLAYLRLLANPYDGISFSRIINVPRRGIGDITQAAVLNLAETASITPLEVCRRAGDFPGLERAAYKLQTFAALMDELAASLQNAKTFAMFIDGVINDTGLQAEIINQAKKAGEDPADRVANLQELVSDVVQFEHNPLPPDVVMLEAENDEVTTWSRSELLDAYLDRVALISGNDQTEDADAVKLMTIHSAKGLEFANVFLIGMEEGIFPGFRSLETENGVEEERRLAYVAVTRAMRRLFITMVRERMLYGRTSHEIPSRFVAEIPTEFLETQRIADANERHAAFGRTAAAGHFTAGTGSFSTAATAGNSAASVYSASSGQIASSGRKPRPKTECSFQAVKAATLGALSDNLSSPANPANPATGNILRPADLFVGQMVRHPRFGVGEIVSLSEVSNDAIVNINFADGKKRMLALSAKLTAAE